MATRNTRPIYRSKQWKLTRLFALEAARWRCQDCGKAGVLEVHHVQPLADGGDPFELDNLRVLCRPCHFAITAAATRSEVRNRLRGFLD
ncbi:MAG: HNH endonuclease signature motif containing protein [Acidobacteriota bacterium]|nr:HNH endonuclease signature motif containing protein [Acidobacteriota bacterium]